MTTPNTLRRGPWIPAAVVVALLAGAGVAWWFATRPASLTPDLDAVHPASDVPEGPAFFRDVTGDSGIDFTYRNGEEADKFAILESVGGGVAMIDYDGDGLLDLFFTAGGYFDGTQIKGHPCKLYKNLGNWNFKDVTAEVGLDKIDFYSHGAAVADFNRDGWPDLLVTGYGRVALFRNEDGKRFVDVTATAGLRETAWCTSAGFADLTGSGYPDLYICHYLEWSLATDRVCKGREPGVKRDLCPPQDFKPLVHALYRNNKNGTFRDVTAEQKLRSDGCGLGVLLADLNGDGRPDIYVANDASDNHLYLNRGGTLQEKGLLAGVAVDDDGKYNGSMGVTAADYDGSGRPALFVTNFQNEFHAFYHNDGNERFLYRSQAVGIAALSRHFVGFGTAFLDIDNDGWEDLVIANGHVYRKPWNSPLKQNPVLMRNLETNGRRVFRDWSKRGGSAFTTPAIGRGVAVGDLDNDGWPDVVISNTNGKVVLLRNIAAETSKARWLGVKLVGKEKRDIIGSTLTLKTDTRTMTRFTIGGGSYLSAHDPRILFGLGDALQVKSLTVKWSWGKEQEFRNLEPNRYHELREAE